MIERQLLKYIKKDLFRGKALILLGARQVGKTTLLERIRSDLSLTTLSLTGDDPNTREQLENISSSQLKNLIGNNKLVIIDEAQRVKNIGITLKLITDNFKNVQLIATGSSAFELANEINEPLTGRKYEYTLFPISWNELSENSNILERNSQLNHRLVYGFYPDVINHSGEERRILEFLSGSYLYKDIFTFQQIRKPEVLEKLLKAIALQVCNEVSYNELAQITNSDPATIERYLLLLEQTYVIFRLYSFSRNQRNELKRSRKIYFFDNGIRNSILANFNTLELRNDIGALWENFLVSERLKYLHYNQISSNRYFWRTTQQQEIDYIEERNGKLFAFEFKWNKNAKPKFSKTFTENYKNSECKLITPDNFEEFVL